ncbi:MAG: hypothetical protein KAH04_01885 [Psychrilyobacter sp.]|nr:hypothetical protein [Psychrilyobacter sp.]
MKKIISIFLLMTISINILADGIPKEETTDSAKKVVIKKEVSGTDKSETTEGRTILDGDDQGPKLEKIEVNLDGTENSGLETNKIEYTQKEQNNNLESDVSTPQAKPNYLVWGLGILGVLVAGLALSSK